MNEHYENIKNKTICKECNSKEMHISYLFEPTGIVKKETTVMGSPILVGNGNLLMIVCKDCGCVAKSFVIGQ